MKVMIDKIMLKLGKLIDVIELRDVGVIGFVGVFLAIVLVRVTQQQLMLGAMALPTVTEYFVLFVNMGLAFGVMMLLIGALFAQLVAVPVARVLRVLLVGVVVIWVPPIVDVALYGRDYWDYYEFASLEGLWLAFVTVFAQTPNLGVTSGMRVEIVITLLAVSVYAWVHISRKVSWSKVRKLAALAGVFVGVYFILFVSGSAPSWIAIAVVGLEKGFLVVSQVDVAQMFLSPQNLLARTFDDPLLVLHGQMSVAYILFLATIVFWWYRQICANWWKLISKSVEVVVGYLAVLAIVSGIVMALMLDTQITWHILTMNTFAIPTILVTLWSSVLLVWSLSLVRVQNEKVRQWGVVGVGGALVSGAVVAGGVLVMLLVVVAIDVLRNRAPFRLAQIPVISYISATVSHLALFGAGVVVVSDNISDIFTLDLIWLILMLLVGAILAVEIVGWRAIFVSRDVWIGKYLSQQLTQFGLVMWLVGTLFFSIVTLNVDLLVVWIVGIIGLIWFGIVLLRKRWLGFTLVAGVALYAVLLLQWL